MFIICKKKMMENNLHISLEIQNVFILKNGRGEGEFIFRGCNYKICHKVAR